MRLALVLLAVSLPLALSSCGGGDGPADAAARTDAPAMDGGGTGEDAGSAEDAPTPDASSTDDAPAAAVDAPGPALDAPGSGAEDAGTDAATSPRDDAGPDGGAVTTLGPVQCVPSIDCPAGAGHCSLTAPGGVCSCFLGTESCPTGTTCDTDIGACVRDCATDADCSAGMRCSMSRCVIRRCTAASPCPAPYVCSSMTSGFCQRPACVGGAACPAPMRCDSDVCVEP